RTARRSATGDGNGEDIAPRTRHHGASEGVRCGDRKRDGAHPGRERDAAAEVGRLTGDAPSEDDLTAHQRSARDQPDDVINRRRDAVRRELCRYGAELDVL